MKKIRSAVFEPLQFTCPVCKCVFEAEGPQDLSLHHDEGEPFLLLDCPECTVYGASVRLTWLQQQIYLPFVLKFLQKDGSVNNGN